MSGSRYFIFAAALAVALAVQGCNRDYKAPKPKTNALLERAGVSDLTSAISEMLERAQAR